jgi:hypothetical protein
MLEDLSINCGVCKELSLMSQCGVGLVQRQREWCVQKKLFYSKENFERHKKNRMIGRITMMMTARTADHSFFDGWSYVLAIRA